MVSSLTTCRHGEAITFLDQLSLLSHSTSSSFLSLARQESVSKAKTLLSSPDRKTCTIICLYRDQVREWNSSSPELTRRKWELVKPLGWLKKPFNFCFKWFPGLAGDPATPCQYRVWLSSECDNKCNNFLLFQLSAPLDVPTPMVTAPGPESASEYPRFSCPPTEVEQGGGGSSYIKTKRDN